MVIATMKRCPIDLPNLCKNRVDNVLEGIYQSKSSFLLPFCIWLILLSIAHASSSQNNPTNNFSSPMLLSSYFGLDNALPEGSAIRICPEAPYLDGMPVIFSSELDNKTIQTTYFEVLTLYGNIGNITCVTFSPATDEGEYRSVLLVGDFGSAEDMPVTVRVTGDVLSKDHTTNYNGANISVTPLYVGPTIVLAENAAVSEWKFDEAYEGSFGHGSTCPNNTTVQAVRVTWDSGVTKANGDEVDRNETDRYEVSILSEDYTVDVLHAVPIADLNDHDNNHLLCLDRLGKVIQVYYPAGYMVDPSGNYNLESVVELY